MVTQETLRQLYYRLNRSLKISSWWWQYKLNENKTMISPSKEPQVQEIFYYSTDKKSIIHNRLSTHITSTPTQHQYSSFALTHHNETVNSTWTLIWITVGKSEGVGSIWWGTRVVSRSEGRTIGMYITMMVPILPTKEHTRHSHASAHCTASNLTTPVIVHSELLTPASLVHFSVLPHLSPHVISSIHLFQSA